MDRQELKNYIKEIGKPVFIEYSLAEEIFKYSVEETPRLSQEETFLLAIIHGPNSSRLTNGGLPSMTLQLLTERIEKWAKENQLFCKFDHNQFGFLFASISTK